MKRLGVMLTLLGIACHRRAAIPPGFQGVVEYEERLLSFEVPGRIAKLAVHRGDVVKVGDPLALLDVSLEVLSRDAHAADAEAAAADLALLQAGTRKEDIGSEADDLRSARSAQDLAQKNLARAKELFAARAIAQDELDRSQAELDRTSSARAAIEQRLTALRHGARPQEIARAQARLASANAQAKLEDERLARYTLRAVEAGAVLDTFVEEGELAEVGTPVATVADVNHPYADVFVPQGEMDGVKIGNSANVRVDATSTAFSGRVEYIAHRTEFTPRFLFSQQERPNLVLRVRVRIDDPSERLHSGVPAFATIAR